MSPRPLRQVGRVKWKPAVLSETLSRGRRAVLAVTSCPRWPPCRRPTSPAPSGTPGSPCRRRRQPTPTCKQTYIINLGTKSILDGGGGGGRLSIIRNGNVIHPVEFKKTSCRPVEFKETSWRPVEFKKTSCCMSLKPKKDRVALWPVDFRGPNPLLQGANQILKSV